MPKKPAPRKRLWALYIVSALFLIILGMFLAGAVWDVLSSGSGLMTAFLIIIPFILIVLLLIMFLRKRAHIIKSGLITKDELTIRAEGRAGRYTSVFTIWFFLALLWYQGFGVDLGLPELASRHIIYLALFFVLIMFSGLRWYFTRKGDI